MARQRSKSSLRNKQQKKRWQRDRAREHGNFIQWQDESLTIGRKNLVLEDLPTPMGQQLNLRAGPAGHPLETVGAAMRAKIAAAMNNQPS